MSRILFVIDTNAYAGNFERPMCAAVTGVVDDTSFDAIEEGKLYNGPGDLEELVGWEDDEGCPRCATCYLEPTSGENNAVAIYMNRKPTTDEITGMKERAETFATKEGRRRKPFKILGYRIVIERTVRSSRSI
jgi:hypothetical protein